MAQGRSLAPCWLACSGQAPCGTPGASGTGWDPCSQHTLNGTSSSLGQQHVSRSLVISAGQAHSLPESQSLFLSGARRCQDGRTGDGVALTTLSTNVGSCLWVEMHGGWLGR